MIGLTPLVQKAINTAARLHHGQYRRAGQQLPYVSHCFSVAWLVAAYGADETTIVAALLHDVLEDVSGYEFADLEQDFGPAVAKIVLALSEQDRRADEPRLPWQERKAIYLESLEQADQSVLLVAAADKIHNLKSLVEAYEQYGEAIWQVFHAAAGDKLWFYEAVLAVLRRRLQSPIVAELETTYQTTKTRLGL